MQALNGMEQLVEGYLLSPQQKRIWKLQQRDTAQPYRAQCVVEIEGNLDAETLKDALRAVVSRHEILRTTFPRQQGLKVPFQVINEKGFLQWRSFDLRDNGLGPHELAVEQIIAAERQRQFDFSQASLIHPCLITVTAQKHVMLITLPALCADAHTLKNLVGDVSAAYASCLGGGELRGEVIQYSQYSEWQNELLDAEQGQEGIEFWQRQLRSMPALKLPYEEHLSEATGFNPDVVSTNLGPELTAQIESLARRYNTSTFVFLLACGQSLLWRLTGESVVGVAAIFDGRNYDEMRSAMGLFAKPLPVRSWFTEATTLGDVLRHLDQSFREINDWEEYFSWGKGASDIIDYSAPPSIMFDFDGELPRFRSGNLTFSITSQYVCLEPFKIRISFAQTEGSLQAGFYYDKSLYKASDIERLAEEFLTLAKNVAANTEAPVTQLNILGPHERTQLLFEFNHTVRDYPLHKRLHEFFEAQAERAPDRAALIFNHERLSYRELNARANQLAHHLRSLGAGPDTLVGICMQPSLEMVISALAVLKAGAAYVPLDPAYPSERLTFMISDAQLNLLLTQRRLRGTVADEAIKIIEIDADWSAISRESRESVPARASADNLAYVIYTSGSTGKPKGVMISHRSICNRLLWMQATYPLGETDQLLQKTSISFDASVWELFVPLMSGATLIVAQPGGNQDSAYLVKLIKEQQVTTLQLVPSMLRVFLNEPGVEQCGSLKYLFCGGEALASDLQEQVFARLRAELINLYGPTEVSIDATSHRCRPGIGSLTVPLGRPLDNMQVYMLDERQQLAPVGLPGEIYVGGEGLARGYLNRPALAAEKFLPNPFSAAPGTRLYSTGDLGRYRPDDTIEFLGRADHQVKLRGFRIELGEIESALSQHPQIRQAVVDAREDAPGDKRLVAYVVFAEDATVSSDDLQEFMGGKLPSYMIPTEWLELDRLPLTPSGKIDRRALPGIDTTRSKRKSDYVAPRTPIEEVLSSIWSDILRVERVGIHDNFFELGGHSLIATQVISRAREVFGVEAPLILLFERPNIKELAGEIELKIKLGQNAEFRPIQTVPRSGTLPLSFGQERLWFLHKFNPSSPAYNLPVAVRLQGSLDRNLLERVLSEIVRRHESLRTTFPAIDGQPIQVIHPARPVNLSVINLADLPKQELEAAAHRLVVEEAQSPFDLATGPLLRAILLQLGEDDQIIIFTLHHIISDGWSTGVLVREVVQLYEAFSKEDPSPLKELPIQYADYAHWQRQWLQGSTLNEQLLYWKKQMDGAPPVMELPTDRPRPPVLTFDGSTQKFTLSAELSHALRALSRRESATYFMVLLAAFKALLHRYTGLTDILVGTPIAGRNGVETEHLIGFFVNTLTLRTDLSGDPTFRELLGRVRKMALEAYVNQDVPFEKLIEELHVERRLSHNPLFQVMFAVQNAPTSQLVLPGLSLHQVETPNTTAKFDLALTMIESGEYLHGSVNYNTNLFDACAIERLIQHYKLMVEGVTANPDQTLSSISILADEELFRLTRVLNDTDTAWPTTSLIHEHFEEQARRRPDATALIFEGEHLAYGALNERANRLAGRLRELGVGPEFNVGIYMERSLELVIALLGVLKAGGAYAPLDPDYPFDRLASMIRNAGIDLALTQKALHKRLLELHENALVVDADQPAVGCDIDNIGLSIHSDHPAYVIHTSGSTGLPKGVMNTHGAIRNRLLWMQQEYRLTPEDRVLQKTPMSFDVSVWEFFWPLMTGACLEIARPGGHKDPGYLASLIETSEITTLHFVPSMLQHFLDAVTPSRCPSLKRVVCSGEALDKPLEQRFFRTLRAGLHNLYGPTEAAVDVTFWNCAPDDTSFAAPIGRPIANTQIYALDPDLQPAPIGVVGELYIGGAGLSRGYINRPETTADRFIPNPLGLEPGSRLYRTGDAARLTDEMTIEYRGRLDHQVKIGGCRIELGEIESALRRHPQIRETVVTAHGKDSEERKLIAYFVAVDSNQADAVAAQLRNYLKELLPDYMIPSHFVPMQSFPLTPGGKVNRLALSMPDTIKQRRSENFVAPQTETEQMLAAIWTEALKIGQVGIYDNFFDLGGNSLLLVRVVSKAREAFEREISIVDMFRHPTIYAMTQYLAEGEREQSALQQTQERAEVRRASTHRQRELRERRRTQPAHKEPSYE
jgi:amino acid adenylation domain-containing protein